MKPSEVAAVLRVSLREVHRMKADGRLQYTRLGPRTIRYYRDSVEKLINTRGDECKAGN